NYGAMHRRPSFANLNPFTSPRATTSSSKLHATFLDGSSVELKIKRYGTDDVNFFVSELPWPGPPLPDRGRCGICQGRLPFNNLVHAQAAIRLHPDLHPHHALQPR